MVYLFSEDEYRRGIAALKNNKASGINDVLVDQLMNIAPKTDNSCAMVNNCFTRNRIPAIWKK